MAITKGGENVWGIGRREPCHNALGSMARELEKSKTILASPIIFWILLKKGIGRTIFEKSLSLRGKNDKGTRFQMKYRTSITN